MSPKSLRREDVDRLLAPEFVEGLVGASVDEIRAKRTQCRRVEYLVSYLRRFVQGQIDLVTAELDLREHGEPDHRHSRVEDLPGILAGSRTAGGARSQTEAGQAAGEGRQSTSVIAMPAVSEVFAEEEEDLAPDEVAAVISPALHEMAFSGGRLPGANLANFTDAEVEELLGGLRRHESSLSAERRVLHERIGQLQAMLVECYKMGVASADTLLVGRDRDSEPLPDPHPDTGDDAP